MSNDNPELCLQLKFLPEFFQQLIGQYTHSNRGEPRYYFIHPIRGYGDGVSG